MTDWAGQGLIYLPDQLAREPWSTCGLSGLLAERAPALEVHSFYPPACLHAVCKADRPEVVQHFRGYLALAQQLHFILDSRDDSEIVKAPEIREAIEQQIRQYCSGLNLRSVRWWTQGPPPLFGWQKPRNPVIPPARPLLCPRIYDSGPWLEIPLHPHLQQETYWPRLTCQRDGQVWLLVPSQKRWLSLSTGQSRPVKQALPQSPTTLSPDGRFWLLSDFQGQFQLWDSQRDLWECSKGPAGWPISLWPANQSDQLDLIGWSGHRCRYYWLTICDGEVGTLAINEHDWPCGHEKKQHGFLDNEPCWVQLSPDYRSYLSVFQKDAMLSGPPPIRWRQWNHGWLASTSAADDPNRALFFCADDGRPDLNPLDPEESDARGHRPTIVMGPDRTRRYALALNEPVYRLISNRVEQVQPLGGYSIFSVEHQLQETRPGRLLGGWGDLVTVLWEGKVTRQSLTSKTHQAVTTNVEPIDWCFPIAGSPNVVATYPSSDTLKIRLL